MKILKDNSKSNIKQVVRRDLRTFKIKCDKCESELEIKKEDTHVGWLGASFITCPCCGEETMVDELEGITLTIDNLQFPVHFNRTNKDMRQVVENSPEQIVKEIKRAITYFRENKGEHYWYTSYGDLFVIVFRYEGDEEYSVMVTKDFYETEIPFQEEDYINENS